MVQFGKSDCAVQHSTPAAVLLVTAVAILSLGGCGSGSSEASRPSATAYCEAFYSRAAPLERKYARAEAANRADPLASLGTLLSSPGDLATMLDAMVTEAPTQIRSETVSARDALRRLQDALSSNALDPAAALASSLATAFVSSGSFQAVGDYLQVHCPLNSPLAGRYMASVNTGGESAASPGSTNGDTFQAPGATNGDTTGTTSGETRQTVDEQVPQAMLPCGRATPVTGASAALLCHPGNGLTITNEFYTTDVGAMGAVESEAQSAGASRTGSCPGNPPAIVTVTYGAASSLKGLLLCYVSGQQAVYAWFSPGDHRYSRLVLDRPDLVAADRWWHNG